MSVFFPKINLGKRQLRQCILTLFVFCSAFFAHSEHYTQVELDNLLTFDQHDCHLCQQGIDSPPGELKLSPQTRSTFNHNKPSALNRVFIIEYYFSPPLRAPPTR